MGTIAIISASFQGWFWNVRDSNLGLPDPKAPSHADPMNNILRVGHVGLGWTPEREARLCPQSLWKPIAPRWVITTLPGERQVGISQVESVV